MLSPKTFAGFTHIILRTCSHRRGVGIFEHNFVDGKANFRRRAVARQENSTQSSGKICRKDARLSYENMFSNPKRSELKRCVIFLANNGLKLNRRRYRLFCCAQTAGKFIFRLNACYHDITKLCNCLFIGCKRFFLQPYFYQKKKGRYKTNVNNKYNRPHLRL